jgi:hypothetical protein
MRLTGLTLALLSALTVPALAATPNNVTVVHGIPGGDLGLDPALPVDVCLIDPATSGETTVLAGVPFGASAGVALTPGFYSLNIRLADATSPCTGAVAESAEVEGKRVTSRGKSTRVFVREKDRWLCLHGHYTAVP